jgi:hypothetical protein
VRADLETFFERIAPEEPGRYTHDDEGPDDMPRIRRRTQPGFCATTTIRPWQRVARCIVVQSRTSRRMKPASDSHAAISRGQ